MRFVTSLILTGLLVGLTFAQTVTVTVRARKVYAVSGLVNPRISGTIVLADDLSKSTSSEAAEVSVTTNAKDVTVFALRSIAESPVELEKDDKGFYGFSGSGTFAVWAFVSDPGQAFATTTITLGEAPPEPDPDPMPNVPDDLFGNIGQRARLWAFGLKKKQEFASCYSEVARRLREEPLVTIDVASNEMVKCRELKLGSDLEAWKPFIEKVYNDLKTRWPMSKGTLADFYDAVAAGLVK